MMGMGMETLGFGVAVDGIYRGGAQLRRAADDFLRLDSSSEKADKALQQRKRSIARQLTFGAATVGATVGAGFKLAQFAAPYEQAERDVHSLGMAIGDVTRLNEEFMNIARRSYISVDFKEMMPSAYDLKSAGIAATQLGTAMETLSTIKSSSPKTTLDDVKRGYTQIYDSYLKKMPGDFRRNNAMLADTWAYTVNRFKTDAASLGISMEKGAASAEMASQPMAALFATFGVMHQRGMQAEEAGTAVDAMLRDVAKSSEVLGISLTDMSGKAIPIPDMVRKIADKFGMVKKDAKPTADQVTLLSKAFGEFGAKGMQRLLSMREDLYEASDATNHLGFAVDMASKRVEGTLGKAFQNLGNEAQVLGKTLGEAVAPDVQKISDAVGGLNKHLGEFAKHNQGLTRWTFRAVAGFGSLVGLIGSVRFVKWIIGPKIISQLGFAAFAAKYHIMTGLVPALNTAWLALAPFAATAGTLLGIAVAAGLIVWGLKKLGDAADEATVKMSHLEQKSRSFSDQGYNFFGVQVQPSTQLGYEGGHGEIMRKAWGVAGSVTARQKEMIDKVPVGSDFNLSAYGVPQQVREGDVTINVQGGPNASASEIADETIKKLERQRERDRSRRMAANPFGPRFSGVNG